MNLLKPNPCVDRRFALHGDEGQDAFGCAGRITFGPYSFLSPLIFFSLSVLCLDATAWRKFLFCIFPSL